MVSVLLVLSIMIFAAGLVAWAVRMIETWRSETDSGAQRPGPVVPPSPHDAAHTPEIRP